MKKFLVAVAVLLALGIGFLAGRVTLAPPQATTQADDSSVTVEVVERELGRVLTLSTTVERASAPAAVNRLEGTVTAVGPGGEVTNGDVLYAVDGVAVRVIAGAIPFHRPLGEGDSGPDVTQVQAALVAAGHTTEAPDGQWRSSTTAAMRAWQRAAGQPETGAMALGELVAVPTLPAQVTLDATLLWPGAALAGGEVVVRAMSGDPTFAMILTPQQAELVPPQTTVTVRHGDHTWEGITGEHIPNDQGVSVPITAQDGTLLCGDQCAALPGKANLLTDVQVIPPETGPVVPVAALTTQPDATTTVTVVSGGTDEQRTVTIRTVADGLAVVDGVNVGEQVRVFGQPSPRPESSPS
ncbi:peptidoglycan-binding protein [Arachnia propionica]|uniref:Peptidoglycan-binding protein n=1 Tax=Arachnia propionica TaxID=1750 RepID=A0A3P1WV49_9ACTN|nr:peptidoglycan-binding domain-containing protein [Arachnia propionica]RRD49778.1 peptidoglycan-binding protein [Arachnia propionica]